MAAQYNDTIRKITLAFGNIFKKITLIRYDGSAEKERIIVPIDYATKELYVMRLQGDPNLDKKVQITLPRMSYEMNGFTYDASRKLNTSGRNFAPGSAGVISQYNPVPYNFDFSLNIYVRNIEDGNQIIENILPFFTPDYTIKVNLIPEMGIVKELPVILKSTDYSVTYEGNRDADTRMVVWTLNFTIQGFIFGRTTNTGYITHSITNVLNNISSTDILKFTLNSGVGIYKVGEYVYQGVSLNLPTASGVVNSYSNNSLKLQNIKGNFVSNMQIIGAESLAKHTFSTVTGAYEKYAQIDVYPNPTNANANSSYTYTTIIKE